MKKISIEGTASNVPFMTVVGGHVMIHDNETGKTLGEDWTGVCNDARDTKIFWYIGRNCGERSFNRLLAMDFDQARQEALIWAVQNEIKTKVSQVNALIADLRDIAIEPVTIQYGEHVSIELRPKNDDDRVLVGRDGWGFTTVNYIAAGLDLKIISEDVEVIHEAPIGLQDLMSEMNPELA